MVDVDQDLADVTAVLTLGVGLLALFLGYDWFWMAFVFGWVVLTPLAGMLSSDENAVVEHADGEAAARTTGAGEDGDSTKDALETLRDRYARGELTEEQFERKVERLLETETVEDARDRVVGRREEQEAHAEPAREREPER